ncbi:hypothetical protein TOPH_05281 [Tolypocladium ophioglossoides CBS 100239]|uniref:Antigenic cell wall galactomannoprotein n=1 Tax=Tolypocladium ophioglossoides (strain CBS 100239) TaxID=1163406 RepID=A0A0L0N861_TOLOC|nr:hypothetical protein TOPH_05281 [Tolypocladium ophioglossoides CBS 100239]
MLLTHAVSLVALAATVLADGKAITSAMNTINSDTVRLGTTVAAWPGDVFGVLPIAGESLALLEDIKKGSQTAADSAPLTQDEALSLATAVGDLAAQVNKTLEAIIAAKPKFDSLLVVSPVIFLNLEAQQKATADFSAKVVAKVPAALQAIARSLIQPIDDGFNKAIAEYRIKL